jgi:hypothetical protein
MAAKTTAADVLVYIPNLIGYMRVALTLTSMVLMICFPGHWIVAIGCYVASFVGDLFDGMAARKFDQCSSFGGLIDMVTDRCSTTGLLCVLSREYSSDPTLVLVRRPCSLRPAPLFCPSRLHFESNSPSGAPSCQDNLTFTIFFFLSAFHDAYNTGHIKSLVSNVFDDVITATSQIRRWEQG